MKIESKFGEFVTIYDKNGNEIVCFESSRIDELENSVCKLLDYLKVDYEFEQNNT